jgi:hypothetical protein
MKKSKYTQAKSAGVMALVSLMLAISCLFVSASGAEIFTGPLFLILSGIACWFWFKGTFGSDEEKQWVESNF